MIYDIGVGSKRGGTLGLSSSAAERRLLNCYNSALAAVANPVRSQPG